MKSLHLYVGVISSLTQQHSDSTSEFMATDCFNPPSM